MKSHSLDFNPFAKNIADALSKFGDVELFLKSVSPPPSRPGIVSGKVRCPYCERYYEKGKTVCPYCNAPAPPFFV